MGLSSRLPPRIVPLRELLEEAPPASLGSPVDQRGAGASAEQGLVEGAGRAAALDHLRAGSSARLLSRAVPLRVVFTILGPGRRGPNHGMSV